MLRMMKVSSISLVDVYRSNYGTIIAFMSIIQAATNDLAQLINNLDLQATPGTLDMTPLRPSPLSTLKRDMSGSQTTSAAASASTSPSGTQSPKNKRLIT